MSDLRSRSGLATAIAGGLCCVLLAATATAAGAGKPEPSRAEIEQQLQAAQKKLDAAAREVADLSMSLSEDAMPSAMQWRMNQRAVLGVGIGSARDDRRQDGVEVQSVSPGGAAAEAGIKAGDVLTGINDKPLKQTGDVSPRSRLLDAMSDIEPGARVTVKYLRDGKPATATITAREPADHLFNFQIPGPGPLHALRSFAFQRADGVFGAAELVPLTPKLGRYFGSDKGLLVVRAPADARLKLEEGDVILDIDGRVPSSPSHALQILASYQPGEKLKLNVLRMKQRITFDVTIPEDAEGGDLRPAVVPALPALPPAPAIHREVTVVTSGDGPRYERA